MLWSFKRTRPCTFVLAICILFLVLTLNAKASCLQQPSLLQVEVLNRYPHRVDAFTQGLEFFQDRMYESSGLYGKSSVAQLGMNNFTEVTKENKLGPDYFAEGLTWLGGKLFLATWRSGKMLVLDQDLRQIDQWSYRGQGWGLTNDDHHLIMSNGTRYLQFLEPVGGQQVKALAIHENGRPLLLINELEWVDGYIFANLWLQLRIVVINLEKAEVVAHMDVSSLYQDSRNSANIDWPNGIAYHPERGTLFITGKNWPWIYEISYPNLDDLIFC